jgi:hypothetical protein
MLPSEGKTVLAGTVATLVVLSATFADYRIGVAVLSIPLLLIWPICVSLFSIVENVDFGASCFESQLPSEGKMFFAWSVVTFMVLSAMFTNYRVGFVILLIACILTLPICFVLFEIMRLSAMAMG